MMALFPGIYFYPGSIPEELRQDIWNWLQFIGCDGDTFGLAKEDRVNVLDNVCDYFMKFREEFVVSSDSTIEQMEEIFFEQLERWLYEAIERLNDIEETVREIMDEAQTDNSDLCFYVNFYRRDDEDDLLEAAETDYNEVDCIRAEAKEVLAELQELKDDNGQKKGIHVFVPIKKKESTTNN